VVRAHRNQLPGYFEHAFGARYVQYPIIDKLVPLHRSYEIDGVSIELPEVGMDYHKAPFRGVMEQNCEARIRNIQVKKNRNINSYQLWVTLWE
jgi:hypothetical protein